MIVFVHLLNDRSGSPRVLCSAIAALRLVNERLCLFVGSDGSGCLDEATIETSRYWYKRMPNRLLTLASYIISQLALMLSLLRKRDIERDAVIYVNTLLPFGAALFGWMTGRPVVYHLHEVSVTPTPLKWFLTAIARLTARRLIYVSNFHHECLPIAGIPSSIIYNAIDEEFLARGIASPYSHRRNGYFRVLMLASLRDYKGVPEFLALADRLARRMDVRFDLVLNDDEVAIHRYFSNITTSPLVKIHQRTNDPAILYSQASLVLNLSRPDQWLETFGLTLLEAMAFGVPVIAPPVGGPLELVRDGQEGFLIDCRNSDDLASKVVQLADDERLCLTMSAAARHRAACFSNAAFATNLQKTLAMLTIEKSAT